MGTALALACACAMWGAATDAAADEDECVGFSDIDTTAPYVATPSVRLLDLHDTGELRLLDEDDDALEGDVMERLVQPDGTVAFRVHFAGGQRGLVSIELVSRFDPGASAPLFCGRLDDNEARMFRLQADRPEDSVLRFRLFRAPRPGSELAAVRARLSAQRSVRASAEATTRVRDQVLRRVRYEDGARDRLSAVETFRNAPSPTNAASALTALGEIRSEVDPATTTVAGGFTCDGLPEPPIVGASVCSALASLATQVADADRALRAYRAALADQDAANDAAATTAATAAADVVLGILRTPAILTEARTEACRTLAYVFWLGPDRRAALRLAAVHEVPAVAGQTLVVDYGTGDVTLNALRGGTRHGVLVRGAPPIGGVALEQRRQGELGSSISNLLRVAAAIGARFSRLLEAQTNFCPLHEGQRRYDPAVAPMASVSSRAWVSRSLSNDRVTRFRVCAGTACSSSNVVDTVTVSPRQAWLFSLFLEVAGQPVVVDLSEPGAGYTLPAYRATAGLGGPDQLYVLGEDYPPGRAVVVSALFGLHFECAGAYSSHCMAALGVSMTDLAGGNALLQIQSRFGVEIVPELYFSWGAGLAFLPRGVDASLPRVVSLPRSPTAAVPDAPPIDGSTHIGFTFSVGLTVDLALLGTAATELINAVGS